MIQDEVDALPVPVNYIKRLEEENKKLKAEVNRLKATAEAFEKKPERNWAMISKYGGEDW